VEKVLQQGEVVGLANHTILVNRIGHEYPIIDNGTPIHDVEGQVSGVVLVFRDQTEERAAQLRLRESEARFRAIFEDAALGIFQASPDGTYRLMNRTFARMYGYDSPEEMTAAITSIQHDLYIRPEERERWTLQLDEVDALQGIEVENRRRDGSSVWVSLNVRAVRGQQGELLYYEGSIEDITQRKHALAALAEQHASLNALLESSSSPIFSLDREYRYLNFNQAHAAVMKALYGAEIMHGHSIKEYMSIAEDWKTAQVNIDRALQGENVLEQAFSGEPGRERRYFEVNHHPVRSLDGEVFGVSVFARDLTEHLQAEERQRWLTGILERSLNEIYAFDPQTLRFSFANQGALKNLGYSLEEITVLTPLDIKPLIDSEEFEVLAAPLRTGQQESVLFETLHQRKDGSRYEALILLQLLPSETGQQFLAIGLDVSESRQAEQKLLESEERYRQLFESMAEGVVMHEIVNDAAGAPVDYRILDCNPAFTRHTGLEPAMLLGKLASEAYGAGEAPYLETYARVVRSGRVERFETFFEPLGRHFEISASPWGENGFVTLFSDISERRQQEDKLKTQMSELRRWYEATLGREQRVIELKREVNEILTTSGQPSRYKSTGSDASPDSG
jgi:PAS domain S-box-containing protein